MFLLSATGAAVVAPLILLVVFAFAGQPSLPVFLALTLLLELVLIFGVGRPAMKPQERVGWALLWGTTAVVLGLCFYYLVIENIL